MLEVDKGKLIVVANLKKLTFRALALSRSRLIVLVTFHLRKELIPYPTSANVSDSSFTFRSEVDWEQAQREK